MSYRITRRRTKGWRMPADVVYIGRGSLWGNPFVHDVGDVPAHELFRNWLFFGQPVPVDPPPGDLRRLLIEHLGAVIGRPLACWCELEKPCHGDWILKACDLFQQSHVLNGNRWLHEDQLPAWWDYEATGGRMQTIFGAPFWPLFL